MQITTIACPPGFTDPNISPDASPVWVDAAGNEYYIASSILEGQYVSSDPIAAQPDRVNVLVGPSGLDALAAMGLTNGNANSLDF